VLVGIAQHQAYGRTTAQAFELDILIFLMGVQNIGKISNKLIAAGRPADTPAAIFQMTFWPGERTITETLVLKHWPRLPKNVGGPGLSPWPHRSSARWCV
jgi:siroheme synthase